MSFASATIKIDVPDSINVHLRMNKDMKSRLKQMAFRRGISQSFMLHSILERANI